MSGVSDVIQCPRCGGELQTYYDWKPHDMTQGICLDCGYGYETSSFLASLEEVNKERLNMDYPPLDQLRNPTPEWAGWYLEPEPNKEILE